MLLTMVIAAVLIALEFNHTLPYAITRSRGVIEAKIVILIAQLAIVRKLIVADFYGVTPALAGGARRLDPGSGHHLLAHAGPG